MTQSAEKASHLFRVEDDVSRIAAPSTSAGETLKTQAREAMEDIVFGSVAGMVGKVIEYPFDTVKVRLQSQPSAESTTSQLRYAGPLDCFAQSLRAGGLASLYRGISAPLFGAAVETSSLFFSYRLAQQAIGKFTTTKHREEEDSSRQELGLGALVLSGAASGAFTSFVLTPIELVKCQMQAGVTSSSRAGAQLMSAEGTSGGGVLSKQHIRSPIGVVGEVWRHHGLLGFWRGQLGTLIRETGGSAAWFGAYEAAGLFFRRRLHHNHPHHHRRQDEGSADAPSKSGTYSLSTSEQLIAGACAGVSYNFLFYPADTIKSRMQTEEVGPPLVARGAVGKALEKPSFWSVGAALWRQDGLKGMYRGCGITVARSAPSSAFIFAVYEALRKHFE